MQRAKENNICLDMGCRFHGKMHYHVKTNDGSYVRFIVENRSNNHADTRRQWESDEGKNGSREAD
jgi:hypothetical protein